jgi:hypothetical protein
MCKKFFGDKTFERNLWGYENIQMEHGTKALKTELRTSVHLAAKWGKKIKLDFMIESPALDQLFLFGSQKTCCHLWDPTSFLWLCLWMPMTASKAFTWRGPSYIWAQENVLFFKYCLIFTSGSLSDLILLSYFLLHIKLIPLKHFNQVSLICAFLCVSHLSISHYVNSMYALPISPLLWIHSLESWYFHISTLCSSCLYSAHKVCVGASYEQNSCHSSQSGPDHTAKP